MRSMKQEPCIYPACDLNRYASVQLHSHRFPVLALGILSKNV